MNRSAPLDEKQLSSLDLGEPLSRTLGWLLWSLLGAVLLGHLVTLPGGGVMTPDSYSYVGMAESARAGSGFLVDGMPTRWPPGYPAILATLMHLGAGTRFAYQVVNFCAVLAGLAILLARLAKRGLSQEGQLVVALLVLLSLPVLYTVNFILSDCVFFLGAVATIELLERALDASASRRLSLLMLAFVALVSTSLVRVAGLTLLPAFLVTTLGPPRASVRSPGRRLLALGLAALAGLLLTVWVDVFILKSGYVAQARRTVVAQLARSGVVDGFTNRGVWRLAVAGRYVLNLEVPGRPTWKPVFVLGGAAGAALLAAGVAAGRNLSRPVEVFVISYLGMIFVYPAFSHRFWLPVFPLALGLVALWSNSRRNRWTRVLAAVYVVVFCALGIRVLNWHVVDAVRSPQPLGERLLAPAPSHR